MITRSLLGIGLALAVAASVEAGGQGSVQKPVPSRALRPVARPVVVPRVPQFYYKDHLGFAHPVVPVFIVPVAPPPPPVPVAKPPCQRFFCE
jgi:hypothetical protein